ncbi:MAG: type II secretion system minor pseudopilin GspH [Gammaproteobacteria bacterium]|nr:type II secretion system minor pseudopilin GspH [Gammaproteobacteria bacterium]
MKPRGRNTRGFSLLELLVVIFIIGMIMTFAALSVGGNADRKVEEEARRLTALLRLATEESVMNSRDLAVQLTRKYYDFMTLGIDGKLVPMDKDEETFRRRELPDDIMIKEAEIEGESVALSLDPGETDEVPSIFILSSGEMIPFALSIGRDEGTDYQIEGDYSGKVEYATKEKQ